MKKLLAVLFCSLTITAHTVTQTVGGKIVYDFCYADPWESWDLVCEIGITDADGTPQSVVYRPSTTAWLTGGPSDARSTQPAVSPDGSKIVFMRGPGYPQDGHPTAYLDLFVFTVADGSLVQLTAGLASGASPTWSPDGTRIAFASDRDGPVDLYVMNANGSDVRRLTNNVGFFGAPAWAPDGARIAFDCVSMSDGSTDICAINSDGTGLARLTTGPAHDAGAAFAPDGRMAFATTRFGPAFELGIREPAGQVNRVGAAGTRGVEPAWSPDGTRLAYMDPDSVSYTGRCYPEGAAQNADGFCVPVNNLFVVNVDGSDAHQFASGAHPRWMPAAGSSGPSPYPSTPAAVPGTIEAENFDEGGVSVAYADLTAGNSGGEYRTSDVDIERVEGSATDYNVGWMSAGEWLQYTINVGAAGSYRLEARVASYGGGGTFHLEVDGIVKTGALSIPDTGGWQQWQTVSAAVTLAAGVQRLRVVLDTNGSSGSVGNLNYLRLTAASTAVPDVSTPFRGATAVVPGTIEAENYDDGGAGVAYVDLTNGNSGGWYRIGDVDIEQVDGSATDYNIGWMSAGEWLQYTINVGAAGSYRLEARVASTGRGGTFHIEVDGIVKTGPLSVPDTGGWQQWQTVSAPVTLAAGVQRLRVVLDTNGSSGSVGNLNYLRLTAASTAVPDVSTPFRGATAVVPGTIEAENYDDGGSGVAYVDLTNGNSGGWYRIGDVDIEQVDGSATDYNIGWMSAGEWLQFTINVGAAGSYKLEARVASSGGGGTFHIEVDGIVKTGPLSVPDTGGWQQWQTVSAAVTLAAGVQRLRVVLDTNGSSGSVGNLNYLRLTAASTAVPDVSTPYGVAPAPVPRVIQAPRLSR